MQARESFKSIDQFGQSVSLTWNGEDQYKTMLGASVSFILIIIISVYASSKLYGTLLRLDPDVSKVSFIRLPTEEDFYKPQLDSFDFAFGLKTHLDPSYGYISVTYINQTFLPGTTIR